MAPATSHSFDNEDRGEVVKLLLATRRCLIDALMTTTGLAEGLQGSHIPRKNTLSCKMWAREHIQVEQALIYNSKIISARDRCQQPMHSSCS